MEAYSATATDSMHDESHTAQPDDRARFSTQGRGYSHDDAHLHEDSAMSADTLLSETLRVLRLWQAAIGRVLGRGHRATPSDGYAYSPPRQGAYRHSYPSQDPNGNPPYGGYGPRGGRYRGMGWGHLARSVEDRRIAGVCAGLADRFGIPATAVRIAFVLLFLTGPLHAIVPYVILAVLLPQARRIEYM